jgi:hypothetical protein
MVFNTTSTIVQLYRGGQFYCCTPSPDRDSPFGECKASYMLMFEWSFCTLVQGKIGSFSSGIKRCYKLVFNYFLRLSESGGLMDGIHNILKAAFAEDKL